MACGHTITEVMGAALEKLRNSYTTRPTIQFPAAGATIIVKTHTKRGSQRVTGDLEKRLVVLEGCVQTEDVTDLKGGAVVHYEVAIDNYVYVVWRRRRKYRFQLVRARTHLLLQARRQSSIHDQLAL